MSFKTEDLTLCTSTLEIGFQTLHQLLEFGNSAGLAKVPYKDNHF